MDNFLFFAYILYYTNQAFMFLIQESHVEWGVFNEQNLYQAMLQVPNIV